MSDLLGRNVAVGFQKESARGTAVINNLTWIGKLDFDFFERTDTVVNESGYGHIAKDSRVDVIRRYGQGGLTTKVFDKSIGHILTLIFGQAPTSGAVSGQSGAYDHEFAMLNSNAHVSYTLAVKESDVASKVYPGTIVEEGTIDIVADDYVKVSASLIGQKGEAPGSTLTPAYTAENEFVPKHAKVYIDEYGESLAGAPVVADIVEAHLTISKNPTNRPTIGSDTVDPRNTVLEITGELQMYYNATTFRSYRDNGTDLTMRIELVNTDVTIGSSTNPRLYIDLPLVKVENWEPDYQQDDLVMQTISIRGLLDLATGTVASATLRNTQSSY